MDVQEQVAAELAIRRAIAGYCQTCDDGRFDEFAENWSSDATVTVMGQTHEGRDAVKAWIEAAQPPEARGKHCTFEPLITIDGPEAAHGTVDFAFVSRGEDGAPRVTTSGRYVDRYTVEDGRWVFASREIVLDG